MKDVTTRIVATVGTSACAALAALAGATTASAESSLPPTWHVHDCTTATCVLPHAPVGFFPTGILHESLSDYLADPARCPDATDKAFLGGGRPPTSDGTEANQPLREGVCMTSDTIIHLKSIAADQPAPAGPDWHYLSTSGGFATYYMLTSR